MFTKRTILVSSLFAFLLGGYLHLIAQSPPFSGTIFLDPDIITVSDPSTFLELEDAGRGMRTMFDRRVNNWITVDAFLFTASFDDGLSTEIQVNPEFESLDEARKQAEKYAPAIGQLPTILRKDAETVWIHKGVEPFGGGNRNILIHTGQADLYVKDGILEETLVHEASHTSLDDPHASAPGWLAAQEADPTFISTYAQDFSDREDIAESFLLYLALRFRPERISESLKNTILQTIPNRIAYFDDQQFDMHPFGMISSTEEMAAFAKNLFLSISPNPLTTNAALSYELKEWDTISIDILNAEGKSIKTILNKEKQPPGSHQLQLASFPSKNGNYFIRLQSRKGIAIKKMMVLK